MSTKPLRRSPRPLVTPPSCKCLAGALPRPATAAAILQHLLEEHPAFLSNLNVGRLWIWLSWEDQLALVQYLQANMAGRRASPEFALLELSLRRFANAKLWKATMLPTLFLSHADVLQESAVLLLQRLGRYEPERARLSTWLGRVYPYLRRGVVARHWRGVQAKG
jgi:hypothetical protein